MNGRAGKVSVAAQAQVPLPETYHLFLAEIALHLLDVALHIIEQRLLAQFVYTLQFDCIDIHRLVRHDDGAEHIAARPFEQ